MLHHGNKRKECRVRRSTCRNHMWQRPGLMSSIIHISPFEDCTIEKAQIVGKDACSLTLHLSCFHRTLAHNSTTHITHGTHQQQCARQQALLQRHVAHQTSAKPLQPKQASSNWYTPSATHLLFSQNEISLVRSSVTSRQRRQDQVVSRTARRGSRPQLSRCRCQNHWQSWILRLH